jgi:ribosome-binding protein aMBF1 (putative translation factor)
MYYANIYFTGTPSNTQYHAQHYTKEHRGIRAMPYISEEDKTTLRDIKRQYGLSTYAIAAIAFVEPGIIYRLEQGGALPQKQVEYILRRLSEVTGQHYSMETVGGYWIEREE